MANQPPYLTVPALLDAAAAKFGEMRAIEDGDVTLSFTQLHHHAQCAAAGVQAMGIQPGDRVAIWAPNMWEWIVAALGIQLAGGVMVPINTRYKGAEARYILDASGAKAIFTVDGFLGLDFLAMLDRPELPTVAFRSTFDAWLPDAPSLTLPDIDPDDLCDIVFTSGTTGRPKGVMAAHSQAIRAFWAWSDVTGLQAGDRYLVVAPFFHCFGYKAGWLACLMRGATILPQAVFDADAVLARIPVDRVSVLPGPPALYQTLLLKPDLADHDLSSLRLAVTGAASIPVKLIHQMRDELGFDTVITGYGLTEANGIATMCRHDDDPTTIATTSGRAIPDVEVQVVDARGAVVAAGTPGEVVVRGYCVMKGYLDNPEATAEALDADGWLHTGDIGVMDERGYLRITDRLKDMFIVGGFNAYPAEIEELLLDHPAVAHVAVIGIPDARMGEVGAAFVVPKAPVTSDELYAWSREHMANFKVPRRFILVDDLPRNASGKITKFALKDLLDD